MRKIAKPSEIPEIDIRPIEAIESRICAKEEQVELDDIKAFVSNVYRKLYWLRRDYDHLHSVIEEMLDERR
jgi:hypothetical protein